MARASWDETPAEDLVEEIGGIGLAHHRFPGWLLALSIGVIAFGLYYLITYSVTTTGSFQAPGVIGGLLRLCF